MEKIRIRFYNQDKFKNFTLKKMLLRQGKVVEEFGFPSIEVTSMERMEFKNREDLAYS